MTTMLVNNHAKMELKKHVNAIHCSNNLTLVQRKLFNALLFNAYVDLTHKQRFEIRGKDLCQLIGYNSKDTAKLKNALLGLITTGIEWNVLDCMTGQEKNWKACSILASAELTRGLCVYEYSQMMKELLYQPDIYGRLNIEIVAKFKSSYGLALYENCIRYQGLTQTPWFSIEIFRKLMGVFENKYKTFNDFKKRVLDTAVKEVNQLSTIRVIPEIERKNQQVTRVRFKLQSQETFVLEKCTGNTKKEKNNEETKNTLCLTFGLSEQLALDTLMQYQADYIQEKIDMITQSDSFKMGKIRGLAGYLIEALRRDYKQNKSSKLIVEAQKKETEEQGKEKQLKLENEDGAYRQYLSTKLDGYLQQLSEKKTAALYKTFSAFIKTQNPYFQAWYKKHGLSHPAIKATLHSFILEEKKSELGDILSKDEFLIKQQEANSICE